MTAHSGALTADGPTQGRGGDGPRAYVSLDPELRALFRQARSGRTDAAPATADGPAPAGAVEAGRTEAPVAPVGDAAPPAMAAAWAPEATIAHDAPEAAPVAPDAVAPEATAVAEAAAAVEPEPVEDIGPATELRLRRDGGRPYAFRGALIVAGAVDSWLASGVRVRQTLALWREAGGRAVLQIVQETPDVSAMRPIHRLTASPSALELGDAIQAHDPIEGYADLPFQTEAALAEARREADRLRGDFRNLARMVLGADPDGRA